MHQQPDGDIGVASGLCPIFGLSAGVQPQGSSDARGRSAVSASMDKFSRGQVVVASDYNPYVFLAAVQIILPMGNGLGSYDGYFPHEANEITQAESIKTLLVNPTYSNVFFTEVRDIAIE